jgi:hypothetical protein
MHRQPDQADQDRTPLAVAVQVDDSSRRAARQAATAERSPLGAPAELAVPASLLAAAQERVAPAPPATAPPATEHSAPAPLIPELLAPAPLMAEPDSRIAGLREYLAQVRLRAAGAASWLETSEHYAHLLNSAGVVPVTARFDARDLAFLGWARADLLGFAELGVRLADLHRPLDAGGTTSDPANPARRCRSCMWRWPCPTLRLMTEILTDHGPGSPS